MKGVSSNDFSTVLRSIIDSYGEQIILEIRLVNILNDYDAFKDIPASKFMLKTLLSDGTIERYVKLGSWSNRNLQFISKVGNATGFQQDILTMLFSGIAYGLGWIDRQDLSIQSAKSEDRSFTSKNNANNNSYTKPELLKILRSHKFIFTKDGKYGIMNFAGEVIHDAIYHEIEECPCSGMIQVRKGKLWGYIDSDSHHSIAPQFDEVNLFNEDRAVVKCLSISENEYVIDRNGDMIIPPIYDSISYFSHGLSKVVIDNLQGFIDVNGEIKVPIEYPYSQFSYYNETVQSENEILITTDYGTKIIDKENNVIAFFSDIFFAKYDSDLGNGKYIVGQELVDYTTKYGVVCNTGKIVIPCRYDHLARIKNYENDTVFLIAKLGEKYGILSDKGKMLIPFQYEEIETQTSNNHFIVKKKDKWGIIGIDGKVNVPFIYDEISYIDRDGCNVRLGDKEGKINYANEWINDSLSNFPIPDDCELIDWIFDEYENKIYLCKKGRMVFAFNEQGVELMQFKSPTIVETII